MSSSTQKAIRYGFGPFVLDPVEGSLCRSGTRVKLQDLPYRLLVMLVERSGEIVTREEVRQRLWPENTFVEFDNSLGVAIRKVRESLNDDAESPRYVETVPRRGYRFLAPVRIREVGLPGAWEAADDITQAATLARSGRDGTPSPNAARTMIDAGKGIPPAHQARLRKAYLAAAVILTLVSGVLGTLYLRHRAALFRLRAQDGIVLADFFNNTGDAIFEDALKQGLAVGLEQSPMLRVLPEARAAEILGQMNQSGLPLSGNRAIEVCTRAGGKVAVQGSISPLGKTYLIGLTAVRCDNSEAIAHEQVVAKGKEDVIAALGTVTSQLRSRLGESLPSIQEHNTPLIEATTPSLDALKAYSQAISIQAKSGDSGAIPLLERAVEIDPNFALAYGDLAAIRENQGEIDLARSAATKAYELRGRISQRERLVIEGWYNSFVTGNLEAATESLEIRRSIYPPDVTSENDLAVMYATLGQHEKAMAILRDALQVEPNGAAVYGNYAQLLLALGRPEEVGAVLLAAQQRNYQYAFLVQIAYWKAFLAGDSAEMQRLLSEAGKVPGARAVLIAEQANTEAYFGRFKRSRQLSLDAAMLMHNDGQSEPASLVLVQAAVREAESQNQRAANELLARSLLLVHDDSALVLAALVDACVGNMVRAQSRMDALSRRFPEDTMVQKYWLPILRAKIELRRGHAQKAVDALAVAAPFERGAPNEFSTVTLYPAYVRGQAYLSLRDGKDASIEFQKLLDHPGMTLNFILGPLARLGHARALRASGNLEEARRDYKAFLDTWKACDSGLPLYVQAKRELAQLN